MSSHRPTASRDIIVIGASAGGLAVLCALIGGLPADFPAALFVVIHTSAGNPGMLPQILGRSGPIASAFARDGEAIEHGRVYVATPDHHLLVERGYVRVTRGPKENGFRPAIDPMFRTAARSYGPRCVGLVLSGALNDGTHGLSTIADHGGVALAQDPQEALISSMPLSAIQNVEVRHVLRAAEMAATLAKIVCEQVEDPMGAAAASPPADTALHGASLQDHSPAGDPSHYTCPDCGGALWELDDGRQLLRLRCHVGHVFTAESLSDRQEHSLEAALWGALRALEEQVDLCRRLAERAQSRGYASLAGKYQEKAAEGAMRADVMRAALNQAVVGGPAPVDADALEQRQPDGPTPSTPSTPVPFRIAKQR